MYCEIERLLEFHQRISFQLVLEELKEKRENPIYTVQKLKELCLTAINEIRASPPPPPPPMSHPGFADSFYHYPLSNAFALVFRFRFEFVASQMKNSILAWCCRKEASVLSGTLEPTAESENKILDKLQDAGRWYLAAADCLPEDEENRVCMCRNCIPVLHLLI